ncbi:MAG: FKBP-type peptidyl-prolyl cis-trans isomerase [Planctomycetes bacterium]|nr:FKBP-type peptidyl-prolyl cis-trans isomerase [Planctomycetota bacterium]
MIRRITLLSASMLFVLSGIAIAEDTAAPASASAKWSDSQKMSYILGTQIGGFCQQNELEVSEDLFVKGLNDIVKGNKLSMSQEDITSAMTSFQQKASEKAQAAQKKASEENLRVGQAFLETNKNKAGVKVTESGLQYKVLADGEGANPEATDRVKVHYKGTLISGKEFDSSYKRGQPVEFGLNQVIKGWTEGLQLMKIGGKSELYIPSELAYGINAPPAIGPGQTLIFTVELIDITTPEVPETTE